MPGPCDWPVSYAECATCDPLDALEDEERERFESMAATFLWNWTGQVYGVCPVVVRPCRQDCVGRAASTFYGGGPYANGVPWGPALIGGAWFNIGCGRCGPDLCSCGNVVAALRLPGPLVSIEEVLIDGAVLDDGAYRVDNGRLLVRTDGGGWPVCQNMALAPDQVDTWQVSYSVGVAVPVGGQVAAGILACELAKAACGDSSCALPQRVQTVTRQGVTIAVLDTFEDVAKGRTGIWLIDSWVASVTKPRSGGRVRSVDVPSPGRRRTTWQSTP